MSKRWFQIRNKAEQQDAYEVLLYGVIGDSWSGDGVEAKAFKKEFDEIPKGSDITLRIHSPGGSVYDGLAIFNTVSARRDEVTVHVDGLAASAASFIAMAGKRVVMPKTSRMMIHDAQGYAYGDSKELKEMAEVLDRESDRIADIYAAKTGKTRAAIRDLMKATTWMDGQEAKDGGFADEVTDTAAVRNEFDLSTFRRVPDSVRNQAPGSHQPRATNSTIMNRTEIIAMLTEHGVAVDEKATDAQLVALLKSTVGDLKAKATAAPPAPPNPAPALAGPTATDPDVATRLKNLEENAERDRRARLETEVTNLCADRRLDVKDWLPLALKDEAQTLKTLKAIAVPEGSAPRNPRGGSGGDDPANLTGRARMAASFKIVGLPE